MGVKSPAIDAMIAHLRQARQRGDFVSAVRALDRIPISGFYVVPLFHLPDQWVARWTRIEHPKDNAALRLSAGSVVAEAGSTVMHAPISMAGRRVQRAAPTIDSIFRANAARRARRGCRDRSARPGARHRTGAARVLPMRRPTAPLRRLPRGCAQIGLPAGTVVGLQMPNIVESILTLLAITRAGMVPATAAAAYGGGRIALRHCRAPAREPSLPVGMSMILDHAQLALDIAAELFPIRVVCGFGCGRVDGIVPFDDCLSAEVEITLDLDVSRSEPSPAAVITFDMAADGPVAVLRDHAQLLAGGMLVQHRAAIQPRAAIVSTIPATSFAGLATSFVPWLLCAGTLVLHHPFEPDALAWQIAEHDCNILVVPDALLLPLTQSETFDVTRSVKTIIALWRSPERVSTSVQWPADAPNLVDVGAFGEAGILASTRPGEWTCRTLADRQYRRPPERAGHNTRHGCTNIGRNARPWRCARCVPALSLRSGSSGNTRHRGRYRRYRLFLSTGAERWNARRHRLASRSC